MREPLRDLRTVVDAAAAPDAAPDDVLAALSLLDGLRRALDDAERTLIGSARDRGTGWPRIAAALGLGSRQAAEQRWLRLSGGATRDPDRTRASRQRQRVVDSRFGPAIRDLRTAAAAAHRRLSADPDWDARHPRAALARTSLAAAADAAPGALYALVVQALDDIGAMPAATLPPALRPTLSRLRRTVEAAQPVRAD